MNLNDVPNQIVQCYGGSYAYGTNLPTSDIDIRGIFCAPKEQICTPFNPIREVELEDLEDGKMHELSTFMKLYCDMNPNILELLWVDPRDVIVGSEAYKELRKVAPDLLSTKVAFTFTGYAMQQMKRIKGHGKWLTNPQPKEPPVRRDYIKLVHNFTKLQVFPKNFDIKAYDIGYRLIPYGNNIFGVISSYGDRVLSDDGSLRKYEYKNLTEDMKTRKPLFIVKLCEEEYKRDKQNHTNYWKWKAERNPVRHEMEEKYGYDCKHATHLVRLLRMGEEILKHGEVIVKRPDAAELLEIRNGALPYDELLKWAEAKDKYIRGELYNKSPLPKKTDIKLASKTLMKVQEMYWK